MVSKGLLLVGGLDHVDEVVQRRDLVELGVVVDPTLLEVGTAKASSQTSVILKHVNAGHGSHSKPREGGLNQNSNKYKQLQMGHARQFV